MIPLPHRQGKRARRLNDVCPCNGDYLIVRDIRIGVKMTKIKISIEEITTFLKGLLPVESVVPFIDSMYAGRTAQVESYRLYIQTYQAVCKEFSLKENSATWEKYLTPYLREITGKTKGFSYPSMIAYQVLVNDAEKAKAWVEGDYDLSAARLKENQAAFDADKALARVIVQVNNTICKVLKETGQKVKLSINTAGDSISAMLLPVPQTEPE